MNTAPRPVSAPAASPIGRRSALPILRWLLAAWLFAAAVHAGPTPNPTAPAGGKPNTAVISVPGGGDTWQARHEAINARARQGHVDLIYLGDSIVRSRMWDGEPVWNHYYAPRHGLIAGMTGDRTEQVLWRLQQGNLDGISPKLAIVMIGQNNGPFVSVMHSPAVRR